MTEFGPPGEQGRRRLPLDLRALAYLWLFFAAADLLRTPIGLFRDELWLPLGAILFWLTAKGLLGLRREWWKVAIVLTGLAVAVEALALRKVIADPAKGVGLLLYGDYMGQVPASTAEVAGTGLLVLSALGLAVLLRPGVRRLFLSGHQGVSQWGRGMKAAIAVVLALAVLTHAAGLYACHRWKPVNDADVSRNEQTGRYKGVYWGYEFSRLAYVVFQRAEGPSISQAVHVSFGGRSHIRLPGEEMELPGRHQLYDVENDTLRTSDARVSAEEFQAFMASNPSEMSLDALLRFVGRASGAT